jgi:hypothetical protein
MPIQLGDQPNARPTTHMMRMTSSFGPTVRRDHLNQQFGAVRVEGEVADLV